MHTHMRLPLLDVSQDRTHIGFGNSNNEKKSRPREDTSRCRTDHRRRCRADASPDRMGGRLLRPVRTGDRDRILFQLGHRTDSIRRLL